MPAEGLDLSLPATAVRRPDDRTEPHREMEGEGGWRKMLGRHLPRPPLAHRRRTPAAAESRRPRGGTQRWERWCRSSRPERRATRGPEESCPNPLPREQRCFSIFRIQMQHGPTFNKLHLNLNTKNLGRRTRELEASKIVLSRNRLHKDRYHLVRMRHWDRLSSNDISR